MGVCRQHSGSARHWELVEEPHSEILQVKVKSCLTRLQGLIVPSPSTHVGCFSQGQHVSPGRVFLDSSLPPRIQQITHSDAFSTEQFQRLFAAKTHNASKSKDQHKNTCNAYQSMFLFQLHLSCYFSHFAVLVGIHARCWIVASLQVWPPK